MKGPHADRQTSNHTRAITDTSRQTSKHKHENTHRQVSKQKHRQRDEQTKTQTERRANKNTDRHTSKHSLANTDEQTKTRTDRRAIQRETQTDEQTQTHQRQTQKQTDREKERPGKVRSGSASVKKSQPLVGVFRRVHGPSSSLLLSFSWNHHVYFWNFACSLFLLHPCCQVKSIRGNWWWRRDGGTRAASPGIFSPADS